jgi:hypothetical protein
MVANFEARLENAVSIPDIFEIVKDATWECMKTGRAGLTCGLASMAQMDNMLIGAMYPVGSNIIVVNKVPIMNILRENRRLFKPYTFHVLLHEYLHSLGYLDEETVRELTIEITETVMGKDHLTAQISKNPERFLPELAYAHGEIEEDKDLPDLEMIRDFDRSSVNYIC